MAAPTPKSALVGGTSRGGQDAMNGDDRAREVPFRRNANNPGRRQVRRCIRAIDTDPACHHDQAKQDDDAQVGDGAPGQPLFICDDRSTAGQTRWLV